MQIPWIYLIQNKDLLSKENKYLDPNFDEQWKEQQLQLKKQQKEQKKNQAKAEKEKKQQSSSTNLLKKVGGVTEVEENATKEEREEF